VEAPHIGHATPDPVDALVDEPTPVDFDVDEPLAGWLPVEAPAPPDEDEDVVVSPEQPTRNRSEQTRTDCFICAS
jgi:hypothetical protein